MDRILGKRLVNLFQKFPAVFLTGPRQSGKTTLAKMMFPNLPYVNFEDAYLRDAVKSDPNGFLEQYDNGVILDEPQNIPEIFPFLQIFIDKRDKPGQYLITGSQNFLLNEKISQSLAGRVAVLSLLPLSYSEIHREYPDIPIRQMIFSGGYPRMYKHQIESQDFFPSYIQTYVERDVRSLKNIEHLSEFRKLLFLCAGRVGQILNLQSLCNDIGISIPTIKSWISLLETSYILYLLRPFSVNTGKQMVKSPKIYFYDTGLLCGLLGIRNEMELRQHYAYGSIFENFVINEILKSQLNKGERENIYFLRDSRGHEIDCLVPHLNHRQLFEIKSSSTFNKDFVKNLEYFKNEEDEIAVIYQGETNFKFKGAEIMNCERFINMMNFAKV